MSYLGDLCLFAHSGVQHILFWFTMLPVSLDCPFLLLQYSLTSIIKHYNHKMNKRPKDVYVKFVFTHALTPEKNRLILIILPRESFPYFDY